MYQFLDRAIWEIDEPFRFLLGAARTWVEHGRSGRCSCAALTAGFAARSAPLAVRDFNMAMAVLDNEALGSMRFAPRRTIAIGEDEARLMTLFAAALVADRGQVRRIAATLVEDAAAAPLATAVEWVAQHLRHGVAVEDKR